MNSNVMPNNLAIENNGSNSRSKWTTILLMSLVITLPIWITALLAGTLLHFNLQNYVPTHSNIFNDAVYYWRQVYTFSQSGFNAGYYTMSELPAPSPISHYYFYGPFPLMIYGTVARLFGWYPMTLVLTNLVLMCISIAVFIFTLRPTQKQLLLLLITLATYWPLILFLPTTMQEGLHMSIAFLFAAGFWVLLKKRADAPTWLKISLFLLIVVATFLRILWGVFFIPFFMLTDKNSGRIILPFIKAAVSVMVCFVIFSYFSAPYPMGFLYQFTRSLTTDLPGAARMFVHQIAANLKHLLADDMAPNILALVFRAQYIGIMLALFFRANSSPRWLRKPKELWNNLISMPADKLLNFANLALIFVAIIVLYDVLRWREYRSMSPHLLFTLLLFIAYRQNKYVIAVIVSSLIVLPIFLSDYAHWGPDSTYDMASIQKFPELVNDVLVYDPNATNAWCNTLLVSLDDQITMYPEIMYIHPSIGFSYFLGKDPLTTAPKSKYLLLQDDVLERNAQLLQTKLLKETPIGGLYLNLAAKCPS